MSKYESDITEKVSNDDDHIGVDCLAFVQRSAKYISNTYKWSELQKSIAEGGTNSGSGMVYPYIGENTNVEISRKPGDGDTIVNLDKIIPGDIFFYTLDEDGKQDGSHIAIVLDIQYANDRNTDISKIYLIESYFDQDVNYVNNIRVINERKDRNWFIVRLTNN